MVATRRSQAAARLNLTSPKRTFADLPDEIIVAVAGWLPSEQKQGDSTSKRHVAPDLGNLSLTNKRIRAVLIKRVLYHRLDITMASYEHLQELREHPELLSGVRDLRLPLVVEYESELHPGQSTFDYDQMLASVAARMPSLTAVRLFLREAEEDFDDSELPTLWLSQTLRTVSSISSINSIDIQDFNYSQPADFAFLLGLLQAWPDAERITRFQMLGSALNVQSYVQLWSLQTFPNLRQWISSQDVNTPWSASLPLDQVVILPRHNTLRNLVLGKVSDSSADTSSIRLVLHILRSCSSIYRLQMDALDFVWCQQSSEAPHAVCLPNLRSLKLRCLAMEHAHIDSDLLASLDRSDTILATSPIQELEADSLEAAQLVCGILTLERVKLSSMRQLLLWCDLAHSLKNKADKAASEIDQQLKRHCAERHLSRLVMHKFWTSGRPEDECACCT